MVQKFIDAKKLDAKSVIDHEALKAAGLARGGKDGVRLLGKGELTAKVSFKVAGAQQGRDRGGRKGRRLGRGIAAARSASTRRRPLAATPTRLPRSNRDNGSGRGSTLSPPASYMDRLRGLRRAGSGGIS